MAIVLIYREDINGYLKIFQTHCSVNGKRKMVDLYAIWRSKHYLTGLRNSLEPERRLARYLTMNKFVLQRGLYHAER